MGKKSFFGGKDDDSTNDADKDNPSTAGSQDPNLARTNESGVDVRPTNILRDDRNPETDQGEVNPHNEAAAQRPGFAPLDPDAERERLRRPKNDKDRKDALLDWGRRMRARGNVMSADWEEFQELTGEREPRLTPEEVQKQQERAQGTARSSNDAQTDKRTASSDNP